MTHPILNNDPQVMRTKTKHHKIEGLKFEKEKHDHEIH